MNDFEFFDVNDYADSLGYDFDDSPIAGLKTKGLNLDDADFADEGEE